MFTSRSHTRPSPGRTDRTSNPRTAALGLGRCLRSHDRGERESEYQQNAANGTSADLPPRTSHRRGERNSEGEKLENLCHGTKTPGLGRNVPAGDFAQESAAWIETTATVQAAASTPPPPSFGRESCTIRSRDRLPR